ncbi:MAG: hypothetical protein BWZ03_00082 [bacterium ADurb.BinA186]|nr:MAG: hypothetical protein BWZ03_00082 [bacterium ADurb.BinA186]
MRNGPSKRISFLRTFPSLIHQKSEKKQLKKLILFIAIFNFSCATETRKVKEPDVSYCVVDNLQHGSYCAGRNTVFIPFNFMDNFVCLSPSDMGLLFEFIKQVKK